MQIDLIAVGKRMPDWIESAVNEYRKRLPKHIQFNLLELTPANRTRKNSAEKFKQQEEERILAAIRQDNLLIVLDETGTQLNSKGIAEKLKGWIENQQSVSIVIGGADGVTDDLKKRAKLLWSLSELTLPHGLVRVMLVEQLYRAWTIHSHHPYHRE